MSTAIVGLPQLAVLAKILCLLMVVMCGAMPAMVRSVSYYSTCGNGNITVTFRSIVAAGRTENNAPYQKLTTQTEDFSKKMYLFAEKAQRYICFSKKWKLVTRKHKSPMCQFYEFYGNNQHYMRFRSVADGTRLIGFNKNGKPVRNRHARQECFDFLKYNPNANIDHHNSMVNSETSGITESRESYIVSRKTSSAVMMRAAKNSLLQADSARGHVQNTSAHRHRHSNHRKMHQQQNGSNHAAVPRRRHGSRTAAAVVEANKY